MSVPFAASAPLTVGVEEEVLLVRPGDHRLAHVADRVLAEVDLPTELAAHEAFASEIELRSPICRTASEARAELAARRAVAADAAARADAALMAVGLHPTAELGDVELVDAERYRKLDDLVGGLIRRTPECALHVHIGMPDAESAVRVLNALRESLPLLQGLAAGSPYWFGSDSGLASARFSIVRAYPRRGVPRAFRDWADYQEVAAAVGAAGEFSDYTFIWWDLRLHPRLGTVEVREMDVQASLDDTAALTALVHALAARALDGAPPPAYPHTEAIAESSFRASRDGLQARILHDGRLTPLAEVARLTLDAVRGHARDIGSDDALEGVERILAHGGAAVRRRAIVAAQGMDALLDQLVTETQGAPCPS
jgi:glutamate---cysteine ligase / carboxylate-amine ligase